MITSGLQSPSETTTFSPTIIDLRSPTKTLEDSQYAVLGSKGNAEQDAYPSPPTESQTFKNGVEANVINLRLDDSENSDSADSESTDGMTDTTSLTGDDVDNDSHGSGSGNNGDDTANPTAPAFDLPKMILSGLSPQNPSQAKIIPTMVLYDDRGLQLFDEITYLDEYYLTQEEIEILERDGDKIVEHIPDNSVVVELGAGSLRKTVLLLNALERKRKNIRYYALDLMLDELTKSLKSLGQFANVKTAGLWGTYDQGLEFVNSFGPDVPKTLLWLGSSIGNLTREEALSFISSYRKTLNVGDNWLIGIDRRNDAQDITIAYNDPKGVTREFIMNGLDHINVILGQDFIDRENFRYFARYNVEEGRHEAYYQVKNSHELAYKIPSSETGEEIRIKLEKDELINVEYSYKWSLEETTRLFEQTEMTKLGQYTSSSNRYDLHIVRKTPFYFDTTGSLPLPSQREWEELWKSWDLITMRMIQHPSMLLEKPIDLRHPFLFYLGHIPVFMDTQISRALDEKYTEPAYFNVIFERGIDPDVDDPTRCHSHSEVPDTWPEIEEIIDFRNRARERLLKVLNDTEAYPMTRRLARVLFMTFEHEVMHLETLVYMMVQSPNTLPPPSLPSPWGYNEDISTPSNTNTRILPSALWIPIDPSTIDHAALSLGHDDPESSDFLEGKKFDTKSTLGWDNENPQVHFSTPPPAFKIHSRQVTNSEFLAYLKSTTRDLDLVKDSRIPSSWLIKKTSEEESICVKTVYGPAPLSISGDWPVSCSNIQATGYVNWFSKESGQIYGIPTEHEISIAFKLKQSTAKTGLENYGFRQWHPALDESCFKSGEGTPTITDFSGPGSLWDWTCTPFAPLDKDGFETSKLYPGYSTDFFDEKHMVVLGASWATHPRIAERRSFRNWYQANYPFVFAGFRLVWRA